MDTLGSVGQTLEQQFARDRREWVEHALAMRAIEQRWAPIAAVTGLNIAAPMGHDQIAEGNVRAVLDARRRRRAGTLTDYVLTSIEEAPEGITRRELTNGIASTPFAEQHRLNPNGFYNILRRAIEHRDVVDVQGRLYSPGKAPATTAAVAEPKAIAQRPARPAEDRIPDRIAEILLTADRPFKASEIINELRRIPGMSERIGPVGALAYAHLSRMVRHGRLSRNDEGKYILPGSKSEAGNVTLFPKPAGGANV